MDEKRKHWEEKLGSEISDELLIELGRRGRPADARLSLVRPGG